jgi:RNA polymerase sigma-70 factor (ECF subfamily)
MIDWDEIVRREGPAVWHAIYRLVRNRADADECFQETFVAAVSFSNRNVADHWPSLLRRLAIARAVDRLRRRAHRARYENRVEAVTAVAKQMDPRQMAETAELADTLRTAIAKIPPRSAEAFCLHELEGWSYEQIADHLSISSGAVGTMLHRARRRLQTLLTAALQRNKYGNIP